MSRQALAEKLPNSIRIIGKDYAIVTCPKASMPNEFGLCDSEHQRIFLMTETSNATMLDTILHECLHGIDFNMHLELSERQVHALAAGVSALLLDNPSFVSFIQEASNGRRDDSTGTRNRKRAGRMGTV